ncbi:MAG TPA: YihY/virulence factor BrkB family protein [Polyangiaceae bacterium]
MSNATYESSLSAAASSKPSVRTRAFRWRRWGAVFVEAAKKWDDDNVSRLAAALSCYTLLSIAPLGILTVALLGSVFGQEAARGRVADEMSGIVGTEAARAIETIIAHAYAPSTNAMSTIVGLIVLLMGASGVFVELQSALNQIWRVAPKPGQGLTTFIRQRFFSFAMVLAVAFLLLVSLLLSAALAATGKFFESYLPGGEFLWQVVTLGASLILTAALFALIFRVVPDVDISFREVLPSALITALLFTVGKLLLGLYLGKSSVTSSYGAAGSLVALVIWVYYSSQIVFFGAELAEVYSRRCIKRQKQSPRPPNV